MEAKITWELQISFAGQEQQKVKAELTDWLNSRGVDSFVEGVIEDLDIDHEEPDLVRDFYGELGGLECPLSIYSYDQEYLVDLEAHVRLRFGDLVVCAQKSMETSVWMEGWKESFKPIKTNYFYIYPPWEIPDQDQKEIPVLIDPGMAFGTGQHATTQICLQAIEKCFLERQISVNKLSFMDVGAGSGILSVAAAKAGFRLVDACDIDPNSIIACKQNADANQVSFSIRKGSLSPQPETEPYDCVVANILYIVLSQMTQELGAHVKPGGTLILSGILDEQKSQMLEKITAEGFELEFETSVSDWVCLCLKKNSGF